MRLGEGKVALPSRIGALCSVLLLAIVAVYTLIKFEVLIYKKNVDIFTAVAENYFDDDYVFGSKQGLVIGVSVHDPFNFSEDQMIDPLYGRVRILQSAWYFQEESGDMMETHEEIETHRCTLEELGLSGNDSKFMPINEQQLSLLVIGARSTLCV